jgi:hypothetical protein
LAAATPRRGRSCVGPESVPGFCSGISSTSAALYASPEPGAWSVNDVLAHLRARMKKTVYRGWELARPFEDFTEQRAELLDVLEPLPPEAWARTANVIGMLRETREHSALYYADWMAGHERVHWRHIGRIIAARWTTGSRHELP